MQKISPLFISLFVIASISVVCSIFVVITIKRYGSKSISSRLVMYLHLTLFLADVSTIPYIYNGNSVVCSIMGFVRNYSGLSNIIVVGMMVQTYRNLFIEDTRNTTEFIDNYAEYLAFLFPLVTALPLSMSGMYEGVDDTWCAEPIHSWKQTLWYWVTSLIWTYIIIIYSFISLGNTLYTVYSVDKELGDKLIKTIVMYALVSIIVWNFIVGSSFEAISRTYANLIVYICGILYFFIFLTEKRSLRLLETFMASNRTDNLMSMDHTTTGHSTAVESCFSWEIDDESIRNSRLTRQNSMNSRFSTATPGSRFSSQVGRPSSARLTPRESSISMGIRNSVVRNSVLSSGDSSTGTGNTSVSGGGRGTPSSNNSSNKNSISGESSTAPVVTVSALHTSNAGSGNVNSGADAGAGGNRLDPSSDGEGKSETIEV